MLRAIRILLVVLIVGPAPAGAEEEHAGESSHGQPKNIIAVFAGVTHEGRREDNPSLGLEYERRIGDRFGVGVLVEHTFSDHDFTVYAVPLAWHRHRLKLFAAPGIEDTGHGNEALLRIGAEYAFEVGAYHIAPQIDVDFVDGEQVVVAGVMIGLPF